MFTTCIFCRSALGANESIEHFPVGKRLAFDADRGRLWAVCPRCARWNLTPLEERWEALEECERAYRGATKRVSTDNIALARLKDGTDLVRIGQPLRPEFAAWRYGDALLDRRRRFNRSTVLATVASVGATAAAFTFAGPIGGVAAGGWLQTGLVFHHMRRKPLGWVELADGSRHPYSRSHLAGAQLLRSPEGSISLTLPYRVRGALGYFTPAKGRWDVPPERSATVLSELVVHGNAAGAASNDLQRALSELDEAGDAQRVVHRILDRGAEGKRTASYLLFVALPFRLLALEMLLHEADERRAMAGELGALYARWEDAERVAKIADGLLSAPATR